MNFTKEDLELVKNSDIQSYHKESCTIKVCRGKQNRSYTYKDYLTILAETFYLQSDASPNKDKYQILQNGYLFVKRKILQLEISPSDYSTVLLYFEEVLQSREKYESKNHNSKVLRFSVFSTLLGALIGASPSLISEIQKVPITINTVNDSLRVVILPTSNIPAECLNCKKQEDKIDRASIRTDPKQ